MVTHCNQRVGNQSVQRNTRMYALVALALLLLFTSACATLAPAADAPVAGSSESGETALSELPKNADGYIDVSVEQLASMMEDKTFTLINVHIPYEGELPQTDAFIAYDEIAAHTDEFPAQDAPIVLYCRSGSMSTQAARILADMGYENILELDGGFNAWKAAGHEFIDQR